MTMETSEKKAVWNLRSSRLGDQTIRPARSHEVWKAPGRRVGRLAGQILWSQVGPCWARARRQVIKGVDPSCCELSENDEPTRGMKVVLQLKKSPTFFLRCCNPVDGFTFACRDGSLIGGTWTRFFSNVQALFFNLHQKSQKPMVDLSFTCSKSTRKYLLNCQSSQVMHHWSPDAVRRRGEETLHQHHVRPGGWRVPGASAPGHEVAESYYGDRRQHGTVLE